MPSTASSYHPPNVVLDDEEPSAVAEPLLGEHRTGQ